MLFLTIMLWIFFAAAITVLLSGIMLGAILDIRDWWYWQKAYRTSVETDA